MLNILSSSLYRECFRVRYLRKGKRLMKKLILDACCGGRMFWFDKSNPVVTFADIRKERLEFSGNRVCNVDPDIIQDFTDMSTLKDDTYYMVVFDPPHFKHAGKTGYMSKKYGSLDSNWKDIIKPGFDECFRVLKPYGTLIFKWNETDIKTSEILKLIERQPLFGHVSGKASKTHWLAFMKIPDDAV